MHTCTAASPMRSNSDPDTWHHPDAVEDPGSYTDTSTMVQLAGLPPSSCGPSVALKCPHCSTHVIQDVPSRGIVGGFSPDLRDKPLRPGEGLYSEVSR